MQSEQAKPYFQQISQKLDADRGNDLLIYPQKDKIYQAFNTTKLSQIRVVIVGQDPYHQADQANGLAFSVKKDTIIPPSLRNIYTELCTDLGVANPTHGDLSGWARQGVLLLNTILTVIDSKPGSHAQIGWQTFTDNAIKAVVENSNHVVFMLWGRQAQTKQKLIKTKDCKILTAPHPSPLSCYRGFFGCRHFSQANNYLISNKIKPINWQVT